MRGEGLCRCRKMYFGTNTKMSMTDREAVSYLQDLAASVNGVDEDVVQMFVIPSYTVLSRAGEILSGSSVWLGAQNMCWEDRGQFTGEVSPLSLRELGVSLIEIGHSERRHIFRETDEDVRKKVCKACELGFTALLCIGETEEEKHYGISDERLAIQLKVGAGRLDRAQAKNLMVAYEPVWAIGAAGQPAEPEYVGLRFQKIRGVLLELFGCETGSDIPLLFGGSVNSQNAGAYISLPEVNGLFVGRSAWVQGGYAGLIAQNLPLYQSKRACRKAD